MWFGVTPKMDTQKPGAVVSLMDVHHSVANSNQT